MARPGKWWRRFVLASFAAVFAAALQSAPAFAGRVERLIMPGDLIEGHAKYEDECSRCHRPFSKATQRGLCLDCHKKVAADVKLRKGYHGRDGSARETECRHCHTDHKGRGAVVVQLDRETFDHGATDYPLKAAHENARCAGCHKPKAKYRDAPGKCISCHKEDDRHKGRLGKKCGDCHESARWSRARFDHDKTDFRLRGKHTKVACNRCHPSDRYKDTPSKCYACHVLSDVHGGVYGTKCGDCHSQKDWKRFSFDHGRKTKFPLKGKHARTDCVACHKGKGALSGKKKKKLDKRCYACHKNDDEHKGRYGTKCESCHRPRGWKKTVFNHDKTDFSLKGRHRKVLCEKCHRGPVARSKKLPTDCRGCHRADDPHGGRGKKGCERCHSESGWGKKVFFDHDLTSFPLIGLHALSPCEECHVGAAYKGTPVDCLGCHKSDDVHKRGLGPKCGRCHNPNDWRLWSFDHDRATDFKLDGAHKGVQCRSCHTRPARKKVRLSTGCAGCHREDDVHRGGFGKLCGRCHRTESFQKIRLLQQR